MIESPNSIIIDPSALEHNLSQAKKLVGNKTRIMGIIKSDAYGQGLLPVSRIPEGNGVDYPEVSHLYEALELRRGGTGSPIAVLCAIRSREEATKIVEKHPHGRNLRFYHRTLLSKKSLKKVFGRHKCLI